MTLARTLTPTQKRGLMHTLERMADKRFKKGREITTGATVGSVRTKEFPVDAVPPEPVQISFVVDVRLLEHPGQPIVRDVLVAVQARQAVADGANQSSTPVLLERDRSGVLTVIGRALHSVPFGHCRDYFDVSDVDGFDLSYVYGLKTVQFQDLLAPVQAGLAAYLASVGEPPLDPADKLFLDPVLDIHGPEYWPGYILPDSPRRHFEAGCVVCVQTSEYVPWGDPVWQWGLPPVGYGSDVVSWGLRDITTECDDGS